MNKKIYFALSCQNTHIDFTYIVLTGDFPAHDLWLQGRFNNLEHARAAVQEILDIFPGVPVFPSIGNHESFPCNRYTKSPSSLIIQYTPQF